MTHFADQLTISIRRSGNPVVVGLDPRWEQLPAGLKSGVEAGDRAAQADVFTRFCREIIDVVAPLVPAVKPQAAFFEQLGPAGMTALGQVIQYARSRNLLVILDGKRNDIGSTATAYADGYLGAESAWGADALTINPYLGDDSLTPFVQIAEKRGAGLFVLVKTSNPGGGQFQDLAFEGQTLYRRVAEYVEQLAAQTAGDCGYGLVGAVVGATYAQQLVELREAMPHTLFLVPGYGSQGGTAKDTAAAFDEQGLGAVINNSRGIIFAYERKEYATRFGEAKWQQAVEAATRDMIDQLRADTTVGKLRP
jgi:orotidine-5'-phosphate decarboxylase